jgi:D-hydroxyproline dehydrogenase subunit gamma
MPEEFEVRINGMSRVVPAGTFVAAAIFLAGESCFRISVSGEPRAALCGMGICFECRVIIDGMPHCRSCQILVQPGMEIQSSR